MTSSDAEVAIAAALAGAEIVRRDYGAEHERTMKSATDFATRTDLDAEEAILDVLSRARPLDALRGEEKGDAGSATAPRRWLVDPLCGTLNFAATTPLVAVNVALSEAGAVTAAAVADPIADELFWTDGEHAFFGGSSRPRSASPAIPSAVSGLVDVNCDGPTDRAFVGGGLVADPRLRRSFGPRVLSST
ncbi:inositol monophosphatase family protein, partial [Kitasatospora sp. NPDC057198]|uniref:inositol monophosphatase family protein n=1 Tax=Kitasatospora sp. NPDC057198 TaxID=3346046 RepID=UPI00363ECD76